MNEPLQRLKAATADLHVEAERHVRILDADATDATYARYLSRMFGFHAPLELAFARHAVLEATGFSAARRAKRGWIAQDLAALGVDVSPPLCADVPLLGNVRRAIGVAYVIEGSTLGGRFVLTKMKPRFAHLMGRATRFLEGYRDDTGLRWKQFAAIAEHVLYDDIAVAAAIAGARETFERLTVWLDEPAMEPPHPRQIARRIATT
ncbi:MAG: biliverdin-producing heme oxygenase [Kofleriaceae bacterium]